MYEDYTKNSHIYELKQVSINILYMLELLKSLDSEFSLFWYFLI